MCPATFPDCRWNSGRFAADTGILYGGQRRSLPAVELDVSAPSRGRPARCAGADALSASGAPRPGIRADLAVGARVSGPRPQSTRPGGEPAAAVDGPAAERAGSDRRCRPAPVRARGGSALRGNGGRKRRPQRNRPGGPLRAVRRHRRGGAVDRLRGAERVVATPAARGAASRGLGRREVLRDAGPDLRRPGPAHRFDGAAVPGARARVQRQVPDARPRPREARGSAAHPPPHHPESTRRRVRRAVATLARPRGPAAAAHPVCALVGGRCRGARGARRHLHHLLLEARDAGGSAARPAGTDRDWRLRRAPAARSGEGSDAQTAPDASRKPLGS